MLQFLVEAKLVLLSFNVREGLQKKIAYISTDNAMAILRNQECAQYVRSGVYLKKQSNLRGPDFMSYNHMYG